MVCFPQGHTCRHIDRMPSFGMSVYVGHIVRMLLVDRSWLCPRFLVQLWVQKDAFSATCIFFHDSWESENILKIQKIRSVWPSFGRSGRRPSSGRRVPRGTCSCICAHVIFTIARAITLAIVLCDRISRSHARSYEQSF